MKISTPVIFAFIGGSVQLRQPPGSRAHAAIQLSDYFANYTSSKTFAVAFGAFKNVTTFEGGLPPPVPLRPAPTPPGELCLALYAGANDDIWENAKCMGANFVRTMYGSNQEAGQLFKPPRESAVREFENLEYEDVEKWGWDVCLDLHVGDFKKLGSRPCA